MTDFSNHNFNDCVDDDCYVCGQFDPDNLSTADARIILGYNKDGDKHSTDELLSILNDMAASKLCREAASQLLDYRDQ